MSQPVDRRTRGTAQTWKTKMCKFYPRGRCLSWNCSFAHDASELKKKQQSAAHEKRPPSPSSEKSAQPRGLTGAASETGSQASGQAPQHLQGDRPVAPGAVRAEGGGGAARGGAARANGLSYEDWERAMLSVSAPRRALDAAPAEPATKADLVAATARTRARVAEMRASPGAGVGEENVMVYARLLALQTQYVQSVLQQACEQGADSDDTMSHAAVAERDVDWAQHLGSSSSPGESTGQECDYYYAETPASVRSSSTDGLSEDDGQVSPAGAAPAGWPSAAKPGTSACGDLSLPPAAWSRQTTEDWPDCEFSRNSTESTWTPVEEEDELRGSSTEPSVPERRSTASGSPAALEAALPGLAANFGFDVSVKYTFLQFGCGEAASHGAARRTRST